MAPNGCNLQAQGYSNSGKNKSKIPPNVIQNIIMDLKNKEPIIKIAKKYNLSQSYISNINNG